MSNDASNDTRNGAGREQRARQGGHSGGIPGAWEPIPQSEGYDGDATAFVQLPPDFMLDGVPLEAPGHGYVPPMITPLQPLTPSPTADPSAAGAWPAHAPAEAERTDGFAPFGQAPPAAQGGGVEYFERSAPYGPGGEYGQAEGYARAGEYGPGEGYPQAGDFGPGENFGPGGGYAPGEAYPQDDAYARAGHAEPYAQEDPHATAKWHYEGAAAPAPVAGATGQWEFPLVPDAVEGGGEQDAFTPAAPAPSPASYAEAPPTLPGGATAPWAVHEPVQELIPEAPEAEAEAPAAEEAGTGEAPEPEHAAEAAAVALESEPEADPEPEPVVEQVVEAESGPVPAPETGPDPDPDPVPDPVLEDAPLAPQADPAETAGMTETAVPVEAEEPPVVASTAGDEHPHISYTLRVNGTDRPVTDSWIGESLLYVLRERLGLAGAKDGCSQGECGACNVQVDGRLVASCLVPAATAAGSEVRTVEGLAVDGEPSDVQRAMAKCGTVQCGFCIPGMCMTVHDLLEGNHAPTPLETRQALAGNLCRCSGYRGVLEAVQDVVAEREATAAAGSTEGSDEARIPHQIPHPHDGGTA